MNLPEHTMIQSMNWLKATENGDRIILSGTNMPITVLCLTSTQEHGGIINYKIAQDKEMSELLADNSDILATSSVGLTNA